jgi:hypothetical protein
MVEKIRGRQGNGHFSAPALMKFGSNFTSLAATPTNLKSNLRFLPVSI